jgi:phage terminase small subunit
MAGYANPDTQGYAIVKSPKVQEAIRYLHKKHEKAADMTRKKVMDGMLEAIDMARVQADSGNMIAGWREIAKMCGYYAPEVKKIDINISAKRVIDKMETLSDDDLMKLVEENANIIEGEASVILDDLQEASDAENGL